MPLPVLQQTPRRRRRRGRRRLAFALLFLLVAGATGGWYVGSDRAGSSPPTGSSAALATTTQAQPTAVAATTAAQSAPLVSSAPARSPHRFPRLGARGAILVDAGSGAVLWRFRDRSRHPIASITKIMTATLVLERRSLHHVVTVDPLVPRTEPFREGLRAGERVPVWKLLYGLLLFSGNDDALALAIDTGGSPSAFIRLMNEKAQALGLRATHFSSPSGVRDLGNYSSARDLAGLARYALRNARFRAIVATRLKRVRWAPPTFSKVYVNKNSLLTTYRGADGVKTGWTTKARHCVVASAHRDGVGLIAVVLGSKDAFRDARQILDWGFATRG